jgi:hypothetical protein
MATNRFPIAVGMDVTDSGGSHAGRVKEVRPNDFLLNRPSALDIYVPFDAIEDVTGNAVILTLSATQIDDMSWAQT